MIGMLEEAAEEASESPVVDVGEVVPVVGDVEPLPGDVADPPPLDGRVVVPVPVGDVVPPLPDGEVDTPDAEEVVDPAVPTEEVMPPAPCEVVVPVPVTCPLVKAVAVEPPVGGIVTTMAPCPAAAGGVLPGLGAAAVAGGARSASFAVCTANWS